MTPRHLVNRICFISVVTMVCEISPMKTYDEDLTGFKSTSLESGKNTVIIPVNCVFIVRMIHVFHHALIWLELLAQQLWINFQR